MRVLEASPAPNEDLRIWFLNDLGVSYLGSGQLGESRRYLERASRLASGPTRTLSTPNGSRDSAISVTF